MKVLVTGAAGQLGRDVLRVAAQQAIDCVGFGRETLDVTDISLLASVVEQVAPDAIIHCAAFTDVDGAESHVADAFAINATGSENVAKVAAAAGVYLVVVSTDYVFAGDNPEGFDEQAPTAPINVYGESKLAGEQLVAAAHPKAGIARTAWLFGADGNNFVNTIARLASSRPSIDVVTDQVGSPTWTYHLAGALLECCKLQLGGVLHLAGAPAATWHDVASEVVAVSGADCEVQKTTADQFPRAAARPACSILVSTREDAPDVGDWREGIRAMALQLRRHEGAGATST